MKKPENKKPKIFVGAGYVIGFFIGLIASTIVFLFTNSIALIPTFLVAFGLPVGMSIEQRFQGKPPEVSPKFRRILLLLTGVGIVVLSVFIFLTKFV